jgi:hypothetical protein
MPCCWQNASHYITYCKHSIEVNTMALPDIKPPTARYAR